MSGQEGEFHGRDYGLGRDHCRDNPKHYIGKHPRQHSGTINHHALARRQQNGLYPALRRAGYELFVNSLLVDEAPNSPQAQGASSLPLDNNGQGPHYSTEYRGTKPLYGWMACMSA